MSGAVWYYIVDLPSRQNAIHSGHSSLRYCNSYLSRVNKLIPMQLLILQNTKTAVLHTERLND